MNTQTLTHSPLPQLHEIDFLAQEIEVEIRGMIGLDYMGQVLGMTPWTHWPSSAHVSWPFVSPFKSVFYAFSALDHTDPEVSFLWFFHCISPKALYSCIPWTTSYTWVGMSHFVGRSGEPLSLTVLDVCWSRELALPGISWGSAWWVLEVLSWKSIQPTPNPWCLWGLIYGWRWYYMGFLIVYLCSSFLMDICCFITQP